MLTVRESRQMLCHRFLIVKGLRTLWEIRGEVGLTPATLKKFVEGKSITTESLQTIEKWILGKESARCLTVDEKS